MLHAMNNKFAMEKMIEKTSRVLIINGPNLNLLHKRKSSIYGSRSLAEIEKSCEATASNLGILLEFRQSNSESEIVDLIHNLIAHEEDVGCKKDHGEKHKNTDEKSCHRAHDNSESSCKKSGGNKSALIINAAGYTHTSVAIRDAIEIFSGIKIEIHLSNIFGREEFRRNSLLSEIVDGVISGFGPLGYELSLVAARRMLDEAGIKRTCGCKCCNE